MKLQTHIPLQKQNSLINYNSKLLLLGSCFAENISDKFEYFKFQSVSNPFGILFHPKAIETLITKAVNGYEYSEKDVFYHNEQWHCYDAHSKLSNVSKERLLNDLNENLKIANNQICNATHIIITLGTAWVYSLLETENTVANCHKVPQKNFNKSLLSVDAICNALKSMVSAIQSVNKSASIIFTVSPVRHIKDGFIENTHSKAHLITAIHSLLSTQLESRSLHYFPSYEIMLDELRDYRFYKEDMLHPNQTAIQYIWKKFLEVWMASEAFSVMKDVDVVQKGLMHKPFNSKSEAHIKFLQKLEAGKRALELQFPHILF